MTNEQLAELAPWSEKLHSIKNRIRIIVKNSNPQKTGVMLYPTVLLFVSYSFTVLQVPKISRFQLFDFAVFRAGRTGFQDIRIAFCWSISMPNIIQSNSFHVRLRTSGRSAIVPLCSQPLVDQGDTVRLFHDCFDPVTSAVAEQKEHGGYSWKTAPVCLHIIHRLTCTY